MVKNTIKQILLTEAGIPFKTIVNKKLPSDVKLSVDSKNKVIFAKEGDIVDRQDVNTESGEIYDPVVDRLYELITEYDVSILTTDYDNALAFREQKPDIDIKVIIRTGEVDITKYPSNLYYMLSLKNTIDGFKFKMTQNLSEKAYEALAIKTIKESSDGTYVLLDSYNEGIMKSKYVKSKVFNYLLAKYVTVLVDDDETYDYITTKIQKKYDNQYLINDHGDTFFLFNVKNEKELENYDDFKKIN